MEFNFLYRDTNLPNNFIEKYKPNTVIVEQGFTDASKFRGGPSGNIRYLILSYHGKDLSAVDENAKQWGLVIFNNSTRFTVLDVYSKDSVTQVFLTDDPDALNNENLTDQAVTAARHDFDELAGTSPAEPLTTDAWKERVNHPLGLNDQGEPFLKNQ